MLESFSIQAVQIIEKSKLISKEMNSKITGTEHLLLAMFDTPESICKFLLEEKGINKEKILEQMDKLKIIHKLIDQNMTFTEKYQSIILKSEELIHDLGKEYVFDEHLFYTILEDQENIAYEIIIQLNLNVEELLTDIEDIFNFKFIEEKEELPYLFNLTKKELPHPFFGRKEILEKIKYILNKKQKNNPLLIGNAGVGKTAIVHALAKEIKTPIYQLELGIILAGTKYRGELEEKILKTMEFLSDTSAIVFIDEIHNIVGSGSNEGTLDIANILKPYLSNSNIKFVGATTLEEYSKYIEKDKALKRRFQNIYIDEPSIEETYQILNHIKKTYEEYHNIKYTKSQLKEIINKTDLLMPNKTFPDKAIDILDEIGSRKNITKEKTKDLISKVILDNTGIKTISLEKLKKLELNYPIFKVKYLKFLNKIEEQNNILVYKPNNQFDIKKFIEDLKKVFNFKEEMKLELDLINYTTDSSINNLIGSSKGYVGYSEGGILSEHIYQYPLSLIIIKNLEYADKQIKIFIDKLINSKSFIDNKSRTIYLSNTIFIINDTITNPPSKTGFITEPKIDKISETPPDFASYLKLLQKHHIKIKNINEFIKNNKNKIDFINNTIDLFYKLLLSGKGEYFLNNNYEYQKDI